MTHAVTTIMRDGLKVPFVTGNYATCGRSSGPIGQRLFSA